MKWSVERSNLKGNISIPASKSHTIRALLIATLADGESTIIRPLTTGDGESALIAARAFGSRISEGSDTLTLVGVGADFTPDSSIFMGNSGTGTRLFTTAAALGDSEVTFDGDSSLRSRPMLPLLKAIEALGGSYSCAESEGYLPFTVKGPLLGGEVTVDGTTSQYLSSLLLTAPLLPSDTVITVENLNEKPYVEMTLWWLDKMGIEYSADMDRGEFWVKGGQNYSPINEEIAGDFSSATFSAVASAITGGPITVSNIDFTDPQGDKGVFEIIESMGVKRLNNSDGSITLICDTLEGCVIDLNAMPDALPALAVLGTIAKGETRLVNVAQARIKETDRISVMAKELSKMGADIEELEDGLIIRESSLKGCEVEGHDDHRIVMALTLAGLVADGVTTVSTVEAADVTYPSFAEDFIKLGAKITHL